jgi:hypothetical protein
VPTEGLPPRQRLAEVPSTTKGARRRGRTLGAAALGLIVTTFTVVCSIQIIQQAWQEPEAEAAVACRPGIVNLISAVRRARTAAANGTGGEREAMKRFREALLPEWSMRPGLSRRCAGDPEATRALGAVDRLRYAEEHALRYEALDVAGRRRDVEAITQKLRESH